MSSGLRWLLLAVVLVFGSSGVITAQEGNINTGEVAGLAMAPAGDQVLTWTGSMLTVWDSASGAVVHEFEQVGEVMGAQWDLTGTRFLSWSDSMLTVWSTESGSASFSVPPPGGEISGAQWAADAALILFWTADGVYQVNSGSGEVSPRFEAPGEVEGISVSADAANIAVSLASDSVVIAAEATSAAQVSVSVEPLNPAGPLRAADLIPGKWQVTWSNERSSCPSASSSSQDRSFILLVDAEEDVIRVEDVVVWSLFNFRYERQTDNTYLYLRNQIRDDGSRITFEYSISIVSPDRIEGSSTVYVSGLNCADSTDMTWTLIDPSVICLAGAANGANLRSGPGTNFRNVGTMPPMDVGDTFNVFDVVGQALGTDSLRWWKLADNTWIREDVVSEEGDCESVPVVPAEETT